jgi:hypothetical protein
MKWDGVSPSARSVAASNPSSLTSRSPNRATSNFATTSCPLMVERSSRLALVSVISGSPLASCRGNRIERGRPGPAEQRDRRNAFARPIGAPQERCGHDVVEIPEERRVVERPHRDGVGRVGLGLENGDCEEVVAHLDVLGEAV